MRKRTNKLVIASGQKGKKKGGKKKKEKKKRKEGKLLFQRKKMSIQELREPTSFLQPRVLSLKIQE